MANGDSELVELLALGESFCSIVSEELRPDRVMFICIRDLSVLTPVDGRNEMPCVYAKSLTLFVVEIGVTVPSTILFIMNYRTNTSLVLTNFTPLPLL